MSVIARVFIPREAYLLAPVTRVAEVLQLDRIDVDGRWAAHYFWIHTADQRTVESTLADLDVTGVEVVDTLADRILYRARSGTVDTFTTALLEHDVDVLYGRPRGDQWEFGLEFADSSELLEFQHRCTEPTDIELEVQAAFDTSMASVVRPGLTECQRETLLRAHEEGYFDVPRGTTLIELSEMFGVSDQAVSERLRRAQSKLIRTTLLDDRS